MTERTRTAAARHAEISARLNEWADALEKYGSEKRRDVDTEIIWWMRKGAEALEAAQRDPRGSLHSDKAEIRRLRAERDAAVAALREAKAELTNETVSYQDGKPLPLDPLTDIDNAIAVIDVALAAVGEAEEPQ